MNQALANFFLLIILGFASMNSFSATEKAAPIDLQLYMGRWYVIANIPYFPERGKVASYDEYVLRKDGRIDNIYGFKKAFGKKETRWNAIAKITPDTENRKWTIKFWGILNADYEILEVATDYSWALIGHPKKKMGWLFSRDPKMSDEQYDLLIKKFENYDYKISAFKRVPQFAEQAGKPGFQ